MAGAKRPPVRVVMPALEIRHHHLVEAKPSKPAVELEDPRELIDRRVDDGNLVGNTPEERFIGQRRRIEVRREDDEGLERHLKFLAGGEGQIVDPVFQRHDPAVQQLLGPDALAAEVVHEQHAAVGFHLQRRLVELRNRVEGQVEHLERQFAAHGDDRPLDADPPAVARAPELTSKVGSISVSSDS